MAKRKAAEVLQEFGLLPRDSGKHGISVVAGDQSGGAIVRLPLAQLELLAVNPEPEANAVRRLAESFRARGQDDPIHVRQIRQFRYQVLAGATRVKAAEVCGWIDIDAKVRQDIHTDADAIAFALRNNLERRTVDDFEAGAFCAALAAEGLKQQQIAERTGYSRSQVANLIRLLDLPEPWRKRCQAYRAGDEENGIPVSVGRAMLTYLDVPGFLDVVAEMWEDTYQRTDLQSATVAETTIEDVVLSLGTRIGPDELETIGEPERKELGCVEVRLRGDDGKKKVVIATNVEAMEARRNSRRGNVSPKQSAKGPASDDDEDLTYADDGANEPADKAARARDRKIQLKEKAADFGRICNRLALYEWLGDDMADGDLQFNVVLKLLPFCFGDLGRHKWSQKLANHAGATKVWQAFDTPNLNDYWGANTPVTGLTLRVALIGFVRDCLWEDGQLESLSYQLPFLSPNEVASLCCRVGLIAEQLWKRRGRVVDSPWYQLAALWFGFHTEQELRRSAKKWQIDVADCKKKSDLLATLLVAHVNNHEPLPCPV